MAPAGDEHIRLAKRVAIFMSAFGRARRLEAVDAGAELQPIPPEVTAGLVAGVACAYGRRTGCDGHAVPRALLHLAQLKPEYAALPERLTSGQGDDTIAAWAELAEAAVDAVDLEADPMPTLRDFASLVRELAASAGGSDDMDFDAVGMYLRAHGDDGPPARKPH